MVLKEGIMITVEDLIERLKDCPKDSQVGVASSDYTEAILVKSPCVKGYPIDNRPTIIINL
jgi:hypothetical protein